MKTKKQFVRLIAVFTALLALFVPTENVSAQNTSPLCFTARNGSVSVWFDIKNVTHTIQYSTNGTSWNTCTSNTHVTINANQSVFFRAATNQTFATPFAFQNQYSQFYFSSTNGGTVEASGNIMSLYGPDCPNLPLQQDAFAKMFYGCTSLIQAPELPATTLATGCYYRMFDGCTSLNQAPALPATTLKSSCYALMFEGCTSLSQAPVLHATTLAIGCYSGMFWGCTSLAQAPALPATTLKISCYKEMFYGCTSLNQAPVLPATTLADWCYMRMFYGCTSLTKTPMSLPATTLTNNCYNQMFEGCTSLTQAPFLPATTLADYCYNRMFYRCTSLIVNTQAPGTPWQIPSNAIVGTATHWNDSIFMSTGGNFQGDVVIGQTYYILSFIAHIVYADANDSAMGSVSGEGYYIGNGIATLVATPSKHHHLANWSNGQTSDTISFVVTRDTTFTAFFEIDKHLITGLSNDNSMGYVTGGGSYDYGTTATLTAIPNKGYYFTSWNDGRTTPTITCQVNGDTTFTANFKPYLYDVTTLVNYSDRGIVTGGGSYYCGSTATLTAIPNNGFHLASWSNGKTTPTISVLVAGDTTLTANFEPDVTYSVTAIANYSNRGTVTGSGQYNSGTTATLTASPNEGYEFSGWDNGETDRVIYVTVTSDTVVTAIFIPEGTGVDNIEETDYIVYSNQNKIFVNGAEGEMVRIYDANGLLVSEVKEASETQEFSVGVAGVYFVRIAEKKSNRVVVK